jgi:putative (di)nucleoside polyphosphate hydrolase
VQKWVAMGFDGVDSEIDLNAHEAEFEDWRWVPMAALPTRAIAFKRDIYRSLSEEFAVLGC